MRYKALLLDFYGTLVEEDDLVIRDILREVAAASPLCSNARELGRAWQAHFRALCAAAYAERFMTQRAIEVASLEWLLSTYQVQLSAQALADRLFAYWRAPLVFADGADFVARSPLPICIMSNIDTDDLRAAITHAGWRFDYLVTSEGCRSYKPRPEMFSRALDMLGHGAGEVLHIGDSWATTSSARSNSASPQPGSIAVAKPCLPARARRPSAWRICGSCRLRSVAGESCCQE